jgi:hypothetical protein
MRFWPAFAQQTFMMDSRYKIWRRSRCRAGQPNDTGFKTFTVVLTLQHLPDDAFFD